jgi:uncharacterized protein
MKTTVLILALIFSFSLMTMAQAKVEQGRSDTINKMDASKQKSGYWEERSGDQISKGYYIEGKKDGNWIICLSSGLIMKLDTYDHGQRDGISLTLDKKAHLVKQEFYKNNILHGQMITYASYGDNPTAMVYYSNGMKNGLSRTYYENGKIQEEAYFKNNVKNGLAQWYNNSGKLMAIYNYNNGQFEGFQKTFYDNDSIQAVSGYSNNVLNGEYKEYYRNGKIKVSGTYLNGVKEGIWIDYDEMGKESRKTKFKAGVEKK